MVGAAIKRRRAYIAVRLLDAADVPGRYQERVARRRAELSTRHAFPCVWLPILMRAFRYAPAVGKMSRVKLDALVEEATVDSNGEDEQVMGLFTMIADNLAMPFQTTVLGVEVTVEEIDLTGQNTIVARCSRGAFRQAICVLDLPLPTPPPDGAEWIEAYRHWAQ
jgi:hypothetical protein